MRSGALLLLFAVLWPGAAVRADTHAVTIRNGASETIRSIQIGAAGRLGENRMRSQLPPGAEARVTYSTGCQADVRLTYASGQTEDHGGLDICGDPRIVAGTAGQASAGPSPAGQASGPTPVSLGATAPAKPGASASTKPGAAAAVPQVAKTPVPPWTGRSITRRFGGME